MPIEEAPEPRGIELAVSDQDHIRPLREWLRSLPDVEVAVRAAAPKSGELGALDTITVLASSGGLIAAIRILPDFIRSRRSSFKIETTVRGERFVLDATNVEELLPVLERLLDD
ncbi:effector-associated constant component EACC1 [Kitasatospora purpeofusca]|uniref:effector-associated constant component EACC1 n=1 Tax=Kitasatospora purpeofusca TaxID=67352 RepID=UPI00367BC3B9